MPEFIEARRAPATWSANSPVSTAWSASITRPPSDLATLSPVTVLTMAASRSRNAVSAASPLHRGAELLDVLRPMPASQSSPWA